MSGGARSAVLRLLLEKGEEVVSVITPWLSPSNSRFTDVITTAVEFGIPVIPVKRNTLHDVLVGIDFDILLSCGFSYIISKETLSLAKYAINSHPTLLPKYRGFRSGAYIIINGETEAGVTVHWMTSEMDKGDILSQQKVSLSPFDTTKSMVSKCMDVEPTLVYDVIQQIKNNSFNAIPQDESKATSYNLKRTPKDSEIDPTKTLLDLYNSIRACDAVEYPAFFYIEGQKVCIKLWRPDKPADEWNTI